MAWHWPGAKPLFEPMMALFTIKYMWHQYGGIIINAMASQITSLTIVYSTVYSRCKSKTTSKLSVTGLCEGNSLVTGEFPAQRVSDTENVSIWWRHHDNINELRLAACTHHKSKLNTMFRRRCVHMVYFPVHKFIYTKFVFNVKQYSYINSSRHRDNVTTCASLKNYIVLCVTIHFWTNLALPQNGKKG